ncbi:DEAD/DEAH box helicase [Candidatus Woesearchaeota archaeon]|nr:DEAD/DEAH box helicase [Candidatus Woesearchaeota archaeon]
MLVNFTPRLYQETILHACTKSNTLVVLPTGMGKTAVALMLAVHRLKVHPNSKILFLSPTRPLVEQHYNTFKKHLELPEEKFVLFTGQVKPEKRAEMWNNAQFIFSTPQGLENDLISNKVSLKDVSLCVFDEAHRGVGEYSYVFIAQQYNKKADFPRVLALTASPGDDLEKITELCKSLGIEEVEVRTDEDPDVKPYVQELEAQYIKVDLPQEFLQVKKFLEESYLSKLEQVKSHGHITRTNLSKTELLGLQSQLFGKITQEKDFDVMKSVSLIAEALKVQHALEMLETQGIPQLVTYFEKLEEESFKSKTKAAQNLVRDLNFRSAFAKARSLNEQGLKHPKLDRLFEIIKKEVQENNKTKIIVFTQYRDTGSLIKEKLNPEGVLSEVFVGQAKKKGSGLTQKEQAALIAQFKDGVFNVLIATSVAEEGLDIPSVDLVVFYEPIPSAIRSIQRRGRTGRQEKGRLIVLIARNTRDEGYRWSAHHKEQRMNTILHNLKSKVFLEKKEKTLRDFEEKEKVKIIADYREKGSEVLKNLMDKAEIDLQQLSQGDYILSPSVGIELKKRGDFVNSILDGRLLEQLKNLRRQFQKPILILEGEQDLYSIRQIHPNAVRGMLATIAAGFGIPIIHTRNSKETGEMLITIARREQENEGKHFNPHFEKQLTDVKTQQEYIVSALPNVGPQIGKSLLNHFKTLQKIFTANEEELKKVEGVGEKTAKGIKEVSEKEYEK